MDSNPSGPTPAVMEDNTACSAVTVSAYPLVIFGMINILIGAHNAMPVNAGNVEVCVGKAGPGLGPAAAAGCGGGGVVEVAAPPDDDAKEDAVPPPVVDTNDAVWHCATPNRMKATKASGRMRAPLDCMLIVYLA